MYGPWNMDLTGIVFFVILGHFFPFYPINNLKNQNLEKKKKTPLGDIIILHLCITNDNHMIYVSWDMECCWQTELFVNLGHFLPAYPSKNHKNENFQKLKKKKNHVEISFYTIVPKIMIICYTFLEIWCVMDVIFIFILCYFLVVLQPEK